jgi:hypothetical protein
MHKITSFLRPSSSVQYQQQRQRKSDGWQQEVAAGVGQTA